MSVTAPVARAGPATAPTRPAEAPGPAADASFNALLGKLAQPQAGTVEAADAAGPADASKAASPPAPAAQATNDAKPADAPDAGATSAESEDDAEEHDTTAAAASDAPAQGTPVLAAPLPPDVPPPGGLVAGLLLQAGIAAGGGRGTAAATSPVASAAMTGSTGAATTAGAPAGPTAAVQPPLLGAASDASAAFKPVDCPEVAEATSLPGLMDGAATAMAGTPVAAGLSTLHAFAPSLPAQAPAAEATVTAPVYQAPLASQPHEAAFGGELSAQVNLMLQNGGTQRAELRLNPAELGPILISLSITGQTADINFSALHAATREGIERSMPALREMLVAQGLSLGQADVSAGRDPGTGPRGDAPRQAPDAGRNDGARDAAAGPLTPAPQVLRPVRAVRGMLDLYA